MTTLVGYRFLFHCVVGVTTVDLCSTKICQNSFAAPYMYVAIKRIRRIKCPHSSFW